MKHYKKTSVLLVTVGLLSLGGCEVYEVPPPYHTGYYYQNSPYYTTASPYYYGAYPYSGGPYYYGPYGHRRHWR